MSKFIHGPAVAGQSVVDRVLAAKHTVAGQSLAKVICKATTEEVMGPKRKHLDYLLQCTNEANVSIPEMANVLIERTQSTNWVVVFKALTTVHNLMNYGNERFTQYLASNNCSFNLSGFTDRSGTQGYDMSTFIRRYAKYLNEKALSYRLIAFDFCKVKRGKEDGILRTMDTEKLLRTLPILQAQLDVLVEFNVSANDLTNGVINAAFMLLFKDLIRLFACYNDGIINLLEKYFEMNKKNCRDALDVYKKFLLRMDRVCEFLKVAENVGIDKGDIPDLAKAPSSLLEALEQHLASLENVKKTGGVDPKVSFGMSTVISNYAVASQLGTAPGAGSGVARISDDERRKILEEEQRQLDQMKQKKQKETASAAPVTFSPSIEPTAVRTTEQPIAVNLGNSPVMPASNLREPDQFSHSVDLIGQQPDAYGLLDPFGNFDMVPRYQSNTATLASNPFASVSQQSQVVAPSWSSPSRASEQGGFDMLQPLVPSGSGLANNGDLTMKQSPDKLIKSDLDSSLASLAGNLNFRTTEQVKKKEHQWFNANETKRITGSQNTWNPSFASASHPVPAQVVGSNSSVFLQPAVFGPTMVPQSQQMVFGQPSNLGWASGQPQAFVMPQSTAYQLHSQPKIPQTMPNDPFGSL